VARLLRERRKQIGLSTTEVARLAGLSQSAVSLLERDLRSPTLETLVRLADAMQMDLVKLMAAASAAADQRVK
jgi:transcriptional regulator with XRE-family HTH domain